MRGNAPRGVTSGRIEVRRDSNMGTVCPYVIGDDSSRLLSLSNHTLMQKCLSLFSRVTPDRQIELIE